MEETAEDSNWEPKEYKPGEYVEQMGIPPKDMPMDLIEEMRPLLAQALRGGYNTACEGPPPPEARL